MVSVKSEMARPATARVVSVAVSAVTPGEMARPAPVGVVSASGCRCESEAASPREVRVAPNSDVVAMICERDGEARPNGGSLSRWRWPF